MLQKWVLFLTCHAGCCTQEDMESSAAMTGIRFANEHSLEIEASGNFWRLKESGK